MTTGHDCKLLTGVLTVESHVDHLYRRRAEFSTFQYACAPPCRVIPPLKGVPHSLRNAALRMRCCHTDAVLPYGCRFKLIAGPGRRRSSDPLGTGGSKLTLCLL
ncbi:hypothetical protein TNCV_1546961 [Trichonephila clavipes]|nr:hypothetical protein TNCV_1546961 [Trichonephila clavipes]